MFFCGRDVENTKERFPIKRNRNVFFGENSKIKLLNIKYRIMITIIKKSVLMIAVICLSLSAFAQTIGLYIDHSKLPACPMNNFHNLKVVTTFYSNGGVVHSTVTQNYDNIPEYSYIPAPSDIATTKIALYFYDSYCGTGQTFLGTPGWVVCPLHFGDWWFTLSPRQVDPK